MDIAVVDDEKAIREHICALIEEQKPADVLYAVLTVFRGYCLQYFLGNFLESRLKSRWNGLCVTVLYVLLRMAVMWVSPPGYEDYKVAVGFRASSHGGNITGPTEEEMRQFEAEQAAKRERREEYARLNEESALKRKLMEQYNGALCGGRNF